MPNRLTKIYTRSGDQGQTSLANGARVHKSSLRIEALGVVDELNSWVGLILSGIGDSELKPFLQDVQHHLFDLGGEIAVADSNYQVINQDDITALEHSLDQFNATLPPLKEFILPGGSATTSQIHLARTVCRRSERVIIALDKIDSESVNPYAVAYLNRLSDFLFVAARFLAKEQDEREILWKPKAQRIKSER